MESGEADSVHRERRYSLSVFGVTGYTGKLVMQYLNSLVESNRLDPKIVPICLVGRSLQKMKDLAVTKCPSLKNVSFMVAEVSDEASIYRAAAETKVLLTCVGPYEQFGEVVIKACISHGTDYVDITGEGRWIETMKTRYDESAKRNGVILVPFAGQDCVPSDLCAYMTTSQISLKEMEESHAALLTITKLPNQGWISSGTFKTVLEWAKADAMDQHDELKVEQPKMSQAVQIINDIPPALGGPLAVLPTRLLPDAKVVHDSHALMMAGRPGVFEVVNAFALPNRYVCYGFALSLKLLPYFMRIPFLSQLLTKVISNGDAFRIPTTASGPITYSVFGLLKLYPLKSGYSDINPPAEAIVTRLEMHGDPYKVTAGVCTQIALALANDDFRASCPGASHGSGFQTPVSAIGGQEIFDRCHEIFRFQLVSRL